MLLIWVWLLKVVNVLVGCVSLMRVMFLVFSVVVVFLVGGWVCSVVLVLVRVLLKLFSRLFVWVCLVSIWVVRWLEVLSWCSSWLLVRCVILLVWRICSSVFGWMLWYLVSCRLMVVNFGFRFLL